MNNTDKIIEKPLIGYAELCEKHPSSADPKIIDFIEQAIKAERKRSVKIVEEMERKEYTTGEFLEHRTEYNEGYNQARKDFINNLKSDE